MPVPNKRVSKTRTRTRRAHHALHSPLLSTCSQCHNVMQPHHACPHCGYYRGRNILHLDKKAAKK